MLKHWLLCIYAVLLMTGAYDLFPLILTCQFNFLSQHPAFHYNEDILLQNELLTYLWYLNLGYTLRGLGVIQKFPLHPMHCGLLIHIPHILVLQWCFICSELAGLRLDCSSVPLKSILFHQTSTHGAFILRVLLGVEWLQGGSASTLDGDWLLCACSLFYHK